MSLEFNECRLFLNGFSNEDEDEKRQLKTCSFSLEDFEVRGEVVNLVLQYLSNRNCPISLKAPITRSVIELVEDECRKDPACEKNYETSKLKSDVIASIKICCNKLLDNFELNKILSLNNEKYSPPTCIVGAARNIRRTMEDRHICVDDFNETYNISNDGGNASFYAVFDGHDGCHAANYSVSQLPYLIGSDPSYPENPIEAIKNGFAETDNNFLKKCRSHQIKGGSTVVCALYHPHESRIYVGWVGDSKALLVKNGHIMQIVQPHKPNCPNEKMRIKNRGGTVMMWAGAWRVNGVLNVSRAIGDSIYKPYVISEPDISCIELDNTEDFLILACDGLWDYVSEDDVASTVYALIKTDPDKLDKISEHLIDLSKKRGSTDNITVIVVFLKSPRLILKTLWPSENMDTTFDNSNNCEMNNSSQVLIPNSNKNLEFKTEELKENNFGGNHFNDGLNNIVQQLNEDTNPFGEFGDDIMQKNTIDNLNNKQIKNEKISTFEESTNDMGPETCVDTTDDVHMISEDTDLLEQSTFSQSKETLPSSDNFNPFDIKNSNLDLEIDDDDDMKVHDGGDNDDQDILKSPTTSLPIDELKSSENMNEFCNEEESSLLNKNNILEDEKKQSSNGYDFDNEHHYLKETKEFDLEDCNLPTNPLMIDVVVEEKHHHLNEENQNTIPPYLQETSEKLTIDNNMEFHNDDEEPIEQFDIDICEQNFEENIPKENQQIDDKFESSETSSTSPQSMDILNNIRNEMANIEQTGKDIEKHICEEMIKEKDFDDDDHEIMEEKCIKEKDLVENIMEKDIKQETEKDFDDENEIHEKNIEDNNIRENDFIEYNLDGMTPSEFGRQFVGEIKGNIDKLVNEFVNDEFDDKETTSEDTNKEENKIIDTFVMKEIEKETFDECAADKEIVMIKEDMEKSDHKNIIIEQQDNDEFGQDFGENEIPDIVQEEPILKDEHITELMSAIPAASDNLEFGMMDNNIQIQDSNLHEGLEKSDNLVQESGEDSEDEWNYIKQKEGEGEKDIIKTDLNSSISIEEPKSNIIETELLNEKAIPVVESQEPKEIDHQFETNIIETSNKHIDLDKEHSDNLDKEVEDMTSQLNPEAKEFVPTSPPIVGFDSSITNGGGGGTVGNLLITRAIDSDDVVVAQSPRKGAAISMENIQVPSENEFDIEISNRPSEIVNISTTEQTEELNFKEAMHGAEKEEQASPDELYSRNDFDTSDIMKESIYIENDNIMNTVQQIPSDIDFPNDTTENLDLLDNIDMNNCNNICDNIVDNIQQDVKKIEQDFNQLSLTDVSSQLFSDISSNETIPDRIPEIISNEPIQQDISSSHNDIGIPILNESLEKPPQDIVVTHVTEKILENIPIEISCSPIVPPEEVISPQVVVPEVLPPTTTTTTTVKNPVPTSKVTGKIDPKVGKQNKVPETKKIDLKTKTSTTTTVPSVQKKLVSSTKAQPILKPKTTTTGSTLASRPRTAPVAPKPLSDKVEKKSTTTSKLGASAVAGTTTTTSKSKPSTATSTLTKRTVPSKPTKPDELKLGGVKSATSRPGVISRPPITKTTSSTLSTTTTKPRSIGTTNVTTTTTTTRPASQRVALSPTVKSTSLHSTASKISPRSTLSSTLRKTEGLKSPTAATTRVITATRQTTLTTTNRTSGTTTTTKTTSSSTTQRSGLIGVNNKKPAATKVAPSKKTPVKRPPIVSAATTDKPNIPDIITNAGCINNEVKLNGTASSEEKKD